MTDFEHTLRSVRQDGLESRLSLADETNLRLTDRLQDAETKFTATVHWLEGWLQQDADLTARRPALEEFVQQHKLELQPELFDRAPEARLRAEAIVREHARQLKLVSADEASRMLQRMVESELRELYNAVEDYKARSARQGRYFRAVMAEYEHRIGQLEAKLDGRAEALAAERRLTSRVSAQCESLQAQVLQLQQDVVQLQAMLDFTRKSHPPARPEVLDAEPRLGRADRCRVCGHGRDAQVHDPSRSGPGLHVFEPQPW